MLTFFLFTPLIKTYGQDEQIYEKQLWAFAFFNWRLNDKWVYSQTFGHQHSYETPTFTRFYTRFQIDRQFTGVLSLHAGLSLLYKINEHDNNAIEIRPWAGVKVRWPYFWRFNFVQYLRLEQRFEHTIGVHNWDNNFRARYKISTSVPINRNSLIDKTFYGILGYEIYSVSFGDDVRFTTAATHRFDVGLGYRQNIVNRYEVVLLSFNTRDENTEQYSFSNFVLFLKYKRYINWE